MADFDEELKRQAAISSLLAQEDPGPSEDSYAASMAPVIKPDTQADYHKLISQAFPKVAEDQPQGPPASQPPPTPPPGLITDPESGARYLEDQEGGYKVPYAEAATEADKQAFKPGDVTLSKSTVLGPAPRAQLIDPDPDQNYFELNRADKPVPGFIEGSKNAILNPAAGVIKPDPTQGNFGDEELARQILAPDKPVPRAQPAVPRADIVQDPIVTRSIAKNIADQSAAVPAPAPAPAQTQLPNAPLVQTTPTPLPNAPVTQAAPTPLPNAPITSSEVTQPASNDDYNKLMDSFFPSTKAASDASSVGTLEAGAGNRVDSKALFGYLQSKFAGSPLIGYVPPDGARWGIKTGSAAEWAAFGLAVAKQESDLNTRSYNASDPGGSVGLFQFGQGQTQFTKGTDQFNPQASADAFVRSVEHYVNGGSVANMGETFGSIRRPNEAGQYIPFAQSVAAGAPAAGATAASNKMPWDDWAKLSPADQAAAEKEGQDFRTQQVSVLDKLNQSTKSSKQFWDILQNPIEGVTDAQRQAYAENWKKQATQSAVDFYSQKGTLLDDITTKHNLGTVVEQHVDPEEAFKKAVSDPGFDAYVGNVGRGLAGAVGQADIGIALAGKSIDRNRVDGFMNLVHPDSTGEGRAGFVKALTDIQDKKQRHDVFNEIYGNLPQNTKDAIGDPASILDSIDHLANPAEQAQLNKAIATKKAWVDQQLAGDPALRGTDAAWWTTGTGENLFNTVAALVPGGVGAVVRTSTLGAQMYSSNMDRIAKEHPDYSPEQVSEEASKSAFITLAPAEAVMALSHGLTAPILKWAGALAEKPIVRFGIGGGVQIAGGVAGSALGQMGANVVESKPILQDVPQAVGSAVVQSLPFAIHGGIGALGHEITPAEHVAPTEPARTEPVPPEPAPSRPITRGEILGPDEPPPPQASRPWYRQGAEPGQDPLVIRGAERTTWTPQELADLVDRAPTTPEGLKRFMEQVGAPTGLHLGDEGALEAEQTRQMRGNRPPITPTELLTRRAPVDLNTAIAQQRAAAALGKTSPQRQPSGAPPPKPAAERFVPSNQYQEVPDWAAVPPGGEYKVNMVTGKTEARWTGEVPGPEKVIDKRTGKLQSEGVSPPQPHVSESEPFVSKVANRYTAERMASGELGHIDPSQGKSTEELIAHGLKMSPDQRERMIDNFSRGVGGDLDNQGAAIRSKEALLSVQSTEAGRAAEADPTNAQLKANADAALKAATDFHNGPVKKFKRVWSDAGRGLQREIPLDYSTLNGIKEAYIKGQGNGKEAPPEMEPKLKQTAAKVSKSAADEEAAINNLGEEIGKRTRGKPLPDNDSIRAKLMKIMGDLPCRN